MKRMLLTTSALIFLSIVTNSCLEQKIEVEPPVIDTVTPLVTEKSVKVNVNVEPTLFPLQQVTNETIGLFVYLNQDVLIDNSQTRLDGKGYSEFEYTESDSSGYVFGYFPYRSVGGTLYSGYLDSIQNQSVSTNMSVSAMPQELKNSLLMVSNRSSEFSFKGDTGNIQLRNIFSIFRFKITKDPGLNKFDNQRIKSFQMYPSWGKAEPFEPTPYVNLAGNYTIDMKTASASQDLKPAFSKPFRAITGTISNAPVISGDTVVIWTVAAPFDMINSYLVFRMETANPDGSIKYATVNVFERGNVARNTVNSFDVVLKKENVYTDDLVNSSHVAYPANSYIISSPGTYAISTKKPGGTESLTGSNATWLWAAKQGGDSSFNIEDLIGDIEYDSQKNMIIFRAGAQNEVFTKGNVIIALRDAGNNIVWSWHIWLTDRPKDLPFEQGIYMDRNLGALTANASPSIDSYGFVYQWGRKDPFYGGDGNLYDEGYSPFLIADRHTKKNENYAWNKTDGAQTLQFAVRNPMRFICSNSSANEGTTPVDWCNGVNAGWSGGSKTENDPCPYGYKVPSKNENGILQYAHRSNSNNYYFKRQSNIYWEYKYEDQTVTTSTFPAAGRRQGRSASSEGIGAQMKFSGTSGSSGRMFYWSGTQTAEPWNTNGAYIIGTDGAILQSEDEWANKADACSVRCIKE